LLRRGRQKLNACLVPVTAFGFDPANRRGALERRSIRVLDPILGQKQADGDDLPDGERSRKDDRCAPGAEVLGFCMERLPGDGQLTRDTNLVAVVLSLL